MFLGYPGSSGPACSVQHTSCPRFGMSERLSEANKLRCQVNGLYLRRMSWKVRATGVSHHCIQWVMLPYTVPWDGNINFWILDVTKDNVQLLCLLKERGTRPWTHFSLLSASNSSSHPDTWKEGRGVVLVEQSAKRAWSSVPLDCSACVFSYFSIHWWTAASQELVGSKFNVKNISSVRHLR